MTETLLHKKIERYMKDPKFHELVTRFETMVYSGDVQLDDLRDAIDLASLNLLRREDIMYIEKRARVGGRGE